jgi:hypothetical protein
MDGYDRQIIDYVSNNEDCTINAVRKYMNEIGSLSTTTTNNRIKNLLESRELGDRATGNHFHKLHVTDKTAYHRINNLLDRIDTFTDAIYKPLKKLDEAESKDKGNFVYINKYMKTFVAPYFISMYSMLDKLLELTDVDNNMSTHDSNGLNNKIIKLTYKIRRQPQRKEDTESVLRDNKRILLTEFQNSLQTPGLNATDNTVNDLLKIIEDFEKQFVTKLS